MIFLKQPWEDVNKIMNLGHLIMIKWIMLIDLEAWLFLKIKRVAPNIKKNRKNIEYYF